MQATARRILIAALFALAQATLTSPGLEAQQPDPRASIFRARGCTECHGVWALHLKARSDVGPDLTFAYVDVVTRYGENLVAFLHNPGGVMRLMLVEHVQLSLADRDSIANILERLYREHRAQLNAETIPIATGVAR
jgi:hypothetical protein